MTLILITGLNGFIALHIARRFLEAGHKVRGTVRSKGKGDLVLSLPALSEYAQNGKLGYVIVPDLIKGDYEEAMKDVEVVIHAASPVNMSNDQTWEQIRDPAVKGTRTVHRAAAKSGVKHVIQISSFASMSDWLVPWSEQDGRVYDETCWNPITDEQAKNLETLRPDLPSRWGGIRYCASKKFSELAAMEEHFLSGKSYKLSILCPPTNLGPSLDVITPPTQQGFSVSKITDLLVGSDKPIVPAALNNYVDVRDLAEATFKVVEKGHEGRLGIRAGYYDHQLVADHIRNLIPELEKQHRIPLGNPGQYVSVTGPKVTLDASKATRELSMTYREFDETVRDAVQSVLNYEAVHGHL
ncbi:hypothetical protein M231_05921 [Tremella mesenterica]|uniref:3-beta hydroxysteroid dehydrogenase/isomerase domain-containing protein n=1 Tax=Tremella mesenterica TaxID=5217 RepID=A0A4V1M3H0_TREME|nr:hypothetical protein M231_05921 [Tremella mesenterica]